MPPCSRTNALSTANGSARAFAKLKALLRAKAIRTIDALCRAIGEICDLFSPQELSAVSAFETDVRFSGREDFWIIVAARSEDETRRSTIVTSQLPLSAWHEVVGDPTYADAILDPLVHNAHRIELAGESLRRARGKPSKTT
jgi:hypothetical protein